MENTTKQIQPRRYIGKGVIFGIIGGIVGGIAMLGILMGMLGMMNLPPGTALVGPILFAKLIGITMGQQHQSAGGVGLGIHLLSSIIIGAIFGAVTSSIKKLEITGYGRGVGFGIATGVIAFVVLFLPVMMGATPIQMMSMMKMMNPAMSSQMIMVQMQKLQPMILVVVAFLAHIIYGAILGAITTVLITKTGLKRSNDAGRKERAQFT
jgi:hypothetical protein